MFCVSPFHLTSQFTIFQSCREVSQVDLALSSESSLAPGQNTVLLVRLEVVTLNLNLSTLPLIHCTSQCCVYFKELAYLQ